MAAGVWLIAGPTASGKSALALRLADLMGAEILNADSMQIYRGLRVLSAGPDAEAMAAAPHHLYGVADPSEAWSVGRWLARARQALDDIARRRRVAVVVGGTGLYLRALTQGLADIPAAPDAVRDQVGAAFERDGEAAFRRRLARLDPGAAERIGAGDRQRLLRAMAVAEATGVALTTWQAQTRPTLAPGAWRGVVLEPPRADLYSRCDARLTAMVRAGALDEVAALTARRLDPEAPAMKALGVRPLMRHLAGELSLDAAVALAALDTRRYAKRQSTWFRNQTPDWPRLIGSSADERWEAFAGVLAQSG